MTKSAYYIVYLQDWCNRVTSIIKLCASGRKCGEKSCVNRENSTVHDFKRYFLILILKLVVMKKVVLNYLIIAALIVSAAFTSCGGGSGSGSNSSKIKMTTESGSEKFYLVGSGVATVDWGDSSEKVSLTLDETQVTFEHTYPNASIRTISINGDNITGVYCSGITSLDVSKNTELTKLTINGCPITSLDVSKNTALTDLACVNNQLTSSALNDLFGTLHSNAGEKKIHIFNNPGSSDCDRSIAERKGWKVSDY